MAHPTCPLCKLQSSASTAAHTLDTRLCEQCQTMVLMALRGANSMIGTSAAGIRNNGAIAQVERESPDDHAAGGSEFFEDTATSVQAFEEEAEPPMAFEPREELRFQFFEDEDPNIRIHPIEADSTAVSENGSSHFSAEVSGEFAQSTSITQNRLDHEYVLTDDQCLTEQPPPFTGSALDLAFTTKSLVEDRREDLPANHEEAVTDPWDAPLPPWDYSHSEWPVLVGLTKRKSFTKLRNAMAAIVVLATAAGFYFLIYRPSTPDPRPATDSGTTARVSTVAEPRVLAAGSADSDAHENSASASPKTQASAASQPTAPDARDALISNEQGNAQGNFSLQAAAFPTQGDADVFAEQLKRAGVPSYVVPAEVARRGRWFRVRVGRFNAAEEAQRFAGEAQQRARAAGVALQLIVCQYNQP